MSKFLFNPETITQAVVQTRVTPGYHAVLCSDAKVRVDGPDKKKPGAVRLMLSYNVLGNPEDPSSVNLQASLNDMVYVPISNEEAGHIATGSNLDFASICEVMHAFFAAECPAWPVWDSARGQFFFDGAPIDKQYVVAYRRKATEIAMGKLVGMIEEGDLQSFVVPSRPLFIKISYKDGSDFPSIRNRSSEHPVEGNMLVTLVAEALETLQAPELPEDDGKPAKAKGKARK